MEEVVQYVCMRRAQRLTRRAGEQFLTLLFSSFARQLLRGVVCESRNKFVGSVRPSGANAISVKREVFRAWCVSCVSCVVSRVGRGRGQLLQSCRGLLYDLSLSLP